MQGNGDFPGNSNDAGDALSEVLDAMRKASNTSSSTEVPAHRTGSAAGRYAECACQYDWAAALRVFADDFRQVVADTDDPHVLKCLHVVARRVGLFDTCEDNWQIGQGLQAAHGGRLKDSRVGMLYRRGVEELASRLPTEAPAEIPEAEGRIQRSVDASPTAHAAAVRAFRPMLDQPAEARDYVRSRAADRVVHTHNNRPSGEFAVWHGLQLVQGLPEGLADAAGKLATGQLPDIAQVRSLVDFCRQRRHGGIDEGLVENVLGLLAWPLWQQRIRNQTELHGHSQWDGIDLHYLNTVVVFGRVREDPRAWPAVTELQKRTTTNPSDLSITARIDGSIIASAWGAFTAASKLLDEAEGLLKQLASGGDARQEWQERSEWFQQLLLAQAGLGLRRMLWRLAQYRHRIGHRGAKAELRQALEDVAGAITEAEEWGMPAQWLARAHVRRAELRWARALLRVGDEDAVRREIGSAKAALNDAEELARRFNEVDTIGAKTRLGLGLLSGDADDLEQSWGTLTTQTEQLKRFPRWSLTARLIGDYASDMPGVDLTDEYLPTVDGVSPMLLGRTEATWRGILHRVSLHHSR